MSERNQAALMPPEVMAIRDSGYAKWVSAEVAGAIRDKFAACRMIPDGDLWQIELEALDGSHFEVNSQLLVAAPE
jgi:hypothetical protein